VADQATKKRAVTGFPAWVVDKPLPDARPEAILRYVEGVATPAPDGIEVDVDFTSINYKDALALTGASGVLRSLPLVAGIDAVGRVRTAAHGFEVGETVVVTGAGLGERYDGGLSERSVLPAASTLRLPDGIDARTAAAVGTAGVTAALAVGRLQAAGVEPSAGRIAVTGAGGGVGAFSVAILAELGYDVVAITGRERLTDHLIGLGAAEVMDRDALGSERGAPMQKARWAAAVDSAGGVPLANLLSQTAPGGFVAACGLAASADLPTTVLPFILRGVSLLGVNSVDASRSALEEAWKLIRSLEASVFVAISPRTEPLPRAVTVARELLAGKVDGRVVIATRD
jgi:acrylyl-CoA reductase (NADPH)